MIKASTILFAATASNSASPHPDELAMLSKKLMEAIKEKTIAKPTITMDEIHGPRIPVSKHAEDLFLIRHIKFTDETGSIHFLWKYPDDVALRSRCEVHGNAYRIKSDNKWWIFPCVVADGRLKLRRYGVNAHLDNVKDDPGRIQRVHTVFQ